MQNRSEPCIWDKYPRQSGTDRQKGGVFAYIYALYASERQRGGQRNTEMKLEKLLTVLQGHKMEKYDSKKRNQKT